MSDARRTPSFAQKAESLVARLVGLNDPIAAAEICEALASCLEEATPGSVDDTLALEAGRLASVRHPNRPLVLLSVGRLYLAAGLLDRAYRALADALQGGAKGSRPYRLLGEALLRLGDAQLAMPMFKRAMVEGDDDPDTASWYACAKAYVAMQEAQGSEAVARDVERRRRHEPRAREAPAQEPLPRFPSLLDCSEISNMATKKVAARKPPRAQPPPLPPEPRSRTDAPCTVSLDEPIGVPPGDPPIDLSDEESSERAETVRLDTKHLVRPPPLPTLASEKPSAKPPPLPTETKTEAKTSEAPPPPAVPTTPPSAIPTTPPAAKAASVAPGGVNQALWESEVTPRSLPVPAPAPPAKRWRRFLPLAQAAALLLAGAAFGFAAGKMHAGAPAAGDSAAAQAPPAAPAATEAAAGTGSIQPEAAPSEVPSSSARSSEAPSPTASAAVSDRPAKPSAPFDPYSPVGRLQSTTDLAVVVSGVPLGVALSPAVAAGKRVLAARPSLAAASARPNGRVWP